MAESGAISVLPVSMTERHRLLKTYLCAKMVWQTWFLFLSTQKVWKKTSRKQTQPNSVLFCSFCQVLALKLHPVKAAHMVCESCWQSDRWAGGAEVTALADLVHLRTHGRPLLVWLICHLRSKCGQPMIFIEFHRGQIFFNRSPLFDVAFKVSWNRWFLCQVRGQLIVAHDKK